MSIPEDSTATTGHGTVVRIAAAALTAGGVWVWLAWRQAPKAWVTAVIVFVLILFTPQLGRRIRSERVNRSP